MKFFSIIFLSLFLCSPLYASKYPMKPYPELYNDKTMPKPDQELFNKCIKWFKTEHVEGYIPEVLWKSSVEKKISGPGINGIEVWPWMFFVRSMNPTAVSKANAIDNGAMGNEEREGGLTQWCTAMSKVIDENENDSVEYKLCKHDLYYFCKVKISSTVVAEKYNRY